MWSTSWTWIHVIYLMIKQYEIQYTICMKSFSVYTSDMIKKKYSLLLSKKMSTPIKNSIAYKDEKSRPPPQNSYLKHVCRKAM